MLIYLPLHSSKCHAAAMLDICMHVGRGFYHAALGAAQRQPTPVLFNQLRWLCAEHFLMHRNQKIGSWICDFSKNKQHYANAIFSC